MCNMLTQKYMTTLIIYVHLFWRQLDFVNGNLELKFREQEGKKTKETQGKPKQVVHDDKFRHERFKDKMLRNRDYSVGPAYRNKFSITGQVQTFGPHTTDWVKLKKNRFRHKSRRDSQVYKSTRMTPMYLMQKSPKSVEITETLTDENEFLSPYSLMQEMKKITSTLREANVTFEVIGRTVEYNDIVLLKIMEQKSEITRFFRADESKYVDEIPQKKIIFIVHGLSVMGMLELPCLSKKKSFKKLLSYYLTHLDKFDIFLVPVANPDGFATWSRLWNKNMSPQNACPGVAVDRNFDVAWNGSHVISSCSQLYPGPSPFSEAESRAIRDVFHRYSQKIIAYLHVHSGTYVSDVFKGDAILYPRGYTEVTTDDDKYVDLKGEIEESMKNASFQVLSATVDTLYNWYGKVTGTSVDYASTIFGIPYALELVMQLYSDDNSAEKSNEMITDNALTEIWRRLIDVTFINIWKNSRTNDVK